MSHYQSPGTSKRLWRSIDETPTSFARVAHDAGEQLAQLPRAPGERRSRIMLTGPRPGFDAAGLRSWAFPALLPPGWRAGEHYLSGIAPVLRYAHESGRRVELVRAAAWFGEGPYGPTDAADAWGVLRSLLRRQFPGCTLLGTPATTGRELFLRTIPRECEWPVLDMETQQLIRSTSGQGRIETLTPAAAELGALVELDGRLTYAALCWGLPGQLVAHDDVDRFEGPRRARYRVRVTVARDWPRRFGMLGVKADAGAWRYPHEPGEQFETWCDGAELALLYNAHGVGFASALRIVERLVFDDYRGKGPLDAWAAKLVQVYNAAATSGVPGAALATFAIRALVLHAIGAFHGREQHVTRTAHVDEADTVPAAALNVRLDGNAIVWDESRGQAWSTLAHPEWSAAIWARARARLLHGPGDVGALHVPVHDVVAFRTDALYLERDPQWPDDGKPGRYRVKQMREGPMRWPATNSELLLARDGRRVHA